MDSTRQEIRESSAKKLAMMHEVTIQSVDGMDSTLITIPHLPDISEDRERFVDAFLYLSDNDPPEWRRIDAFNTANGQVAVNRVFDNDPSPGDDAQIYLLLNPDEWNDAINEVLTKLYFHVRDTMAIVDDQTEYNLPAYVQYKGMVVDMRYRALTNNITNPGKEEPIPRYKLDETANSVVLHLLDKPRSSVQYEIIAELKRYYPALTQDTTSDPSDGDDDLGVTTCPEPLWQPGVVVSALHKLMNKFGDRYRKNYMQNLAIAERDFAEARVKVLPMVTPREYVQDEEWAGYPDVDVFFINPGWM